jgi:glycosyltransferase involved in cell wall biosynthesis
MRVFILSPNQIERFNWGWQLFRDEIGRQAEAVYYGEGYPNHDSLYLPEVLSNYDPFDIMFVGDAKYVKQYEGYKEVKIPKVFIMGDYYNYHPSDKAYYFERTNMFIIRAGIDVIGYKTPQAYALLKTAQRSGLLPEDLKTIPLDYSVDTNIYKDYGFERTIDVAAIFNHFAPWCYPMRGTIKEVVSELAKFGIKVLIGDRDIGPIRYEYAKALARSKIFVNNCNIFGSASWKVGEVLASGTLLLTDHIYDAEHLGYKEDENYVCYKTIEELVQKIRYYLKHPEEREEIAKRGMKLVHKNHSNEVRVRQMFEDLEGIYGFGR